MRQAQALHFSTHDGVELHYRHWPPPATSTSHARAVVMFHRGHEHGGRMAHLADELDLPGYDFFAWDARGHGQSPGARGDSPGFATSVRDVQTFIEHIAAHHGIAEADMVVLAQSVGAVLIATWAHDYAPKVRCLVLASPAFKVKLYVPFARPGLKLLKALRGNFFVNSYVKPRLLSHDPERVMSYEADPLISRPISVTMLLGLYEAADRVVADAQAIQVPTQLLVSGADFRGRAPAPGTLLRTAGQPQKEMHILPGFFHDTLGERDRAHALKRIERFVGALLRQPRRAALTARCRQDRRQLRRSRKPWPHHCRATRRVTFTGAPPAPACAWARACRRGETGLRHRLRLRQHPRLRVPQPTHRQGQAGPPDRPATTSTPSAGAVFASASCTSRNCCAWPSPGCANNNGPCTLSISPPAMAATSSKPCKALSSCRNRSCCATTASINVQQGSALIAEKGLGDIARFVQGDAFDRQSLATLDTTDPGGGLRALRTVPQQPAGGQLAGRPGRCRGRWRLPGLHRPAVAPATGNDRPRPDQPPRAARPG